MEAKFYKDKTINKAEYKTFLQLLNPFAPHMTEEIFEKLGETKTINETPWPEYDEEKTIEKSVESQKNIIQNDTNNNVILKTDPELIIEYDDAVATDTAYYEEILKSFENNKITITDDDCKNVYGRRRTSRSEKLSKNKRRR